MAENQTTENVATEPVVEVEKTPNRFTQFIKNLPRTVKVVGAATGVAALVGVGLVALSKNAEQDAPLDHDGPNDIIVELDPATNTLEVKEA